MAPKVTEVTKQRENLFNKVKRERDEKFIRETKPKKFSDVQVARYQGISKTWDEVSIWLRRLRNPETNDYTVDVYNEQPVEYEDGSFQMEMVKVMTVTNQPKLLQSKRMWMSK